MRADLRRDGLGHLLLQFVESLTHLDGKIPRTLRLLLGRPGRLTTEFLRGARQPYLGPIQLALLANVVYFLLQTWLDWNAMSTPFRVHVGGMNYSHLTLAHAQEFAARHSMELEAVERAFDAAVVPYSKSLVLVMAPLFAGFVHLAKGSSWRGVLGSVVYSLHFYAVVLLAFGLVLLPIGTAMQSGWIGADAARHTDAVLALSALGAVLAYHVAALRVSLQQSWKHAVLGGLLLMFGFVITNLLYRVFLFLIVLHTMPIDGR